MLGRKKFPHVLLLHAGGLDGRMWHPFAERLKDSYRLHMPDLRGHGETPMPPKEFSNVDDVVRLLDQLKVKRAVVVGASFGGRVALQLATAAPERVSALALLASALPEDEDTERPMCFATFAPAAAATNAEQVEMLKVCAESPPVPQVSTR